MTPDDPRHGTAIGYNQHRREGEEACDACKRGAARYQATRENEKAHGNPRSLDPRGTIRRLQALQAIGWPFQAMADHLGWVNGEQVNALLRNRYIFRDTHARICDMYEALSGTPGPSAITRKRAAAKGYAPPLAWDDIDNDDHPQGHQQCQHDDCVREPQHLGLCSMHYDQATRERRRSA